MSFNRRHMNSLNHSVSDALWQKGYVAISKAFAMRALPGRPSF